MVLGCLTATFFLSSFSQTIAQEKLDHTAEENYGVQFDLTQHSEGQPAKEIVGKDSVAIKSVGVRVKPVVPMAKTKTEEETLSFNFLYFIIQRFKVSDITD
jgi:hypothetical protein